MKANLNLRDHLPERIAILIAVIFISALFLTACQKEETASPSLPAAEINFSKDKVRHETIPAITIEHFPAQRAGDEPVYKIEIFNEGVAVYEGISNVLVKGKVSMSIGKVAAKNMVREFLNSGFLRLPSAIEGSIRVPLTVTKLAAGDIQKSVADRGQNVPLFFKKLKSVVEQAAQAEKYVHGYNLENAQSHDQSSSGF